MSGSRGPEAAGKPILTDIAAEVFKEGRELTQEERQAILVHYIPLIHFVAGRLATRLPPNVSLDDLIGAGAIGLMDALDKYDPSKGVQFKTYAEFRIRGAILDELRSMDWVPRSVRKKIARLERAYLELERELGRPAEDEEVARALNMGLEELYTLLDQAKGVTFLDIDFIKKRLPENHSDEDLFDLIADEDGPDPFQQLNLMEVKQVLVEAISQLPQKEQLVLSLYYFEELTMKEIGEIMGYTESRISQMHSRAILRLRGKLASVREEVGGPLI